MKRPTRALMVAAVAATAAGACANASIAVTGTGVPAVVWTECADRLDRTYATASLTDVAAHCGRMVVPLQWDDPERSGTVRVALVRLRSQDQHDRIGSLVINPGGPGGSGVDAAVLMWNELPRAIRERFDVVGFDPRGVGKSSPLVCSLFSFGSGIWFDTDPDDLVELHADAAQANTECAERRSAMVPWINTVQTARDLDAIRAALGDDRLTYLGWSYGTELGAVYAELHPDRVRALVLDGAVDLRLRNAQLTAGQATGFERAFDEMTRRCDNDRSCAFWPDSAQRFDALLESLWESPVDTDDGWYVDGDTIGWDTLFTLYDDRNWSRWWDVLAALEAGDGDPYDSLVGSGATVNQYRNLGDAYTAVMCSDRPDRISPEAAVVAARAIGADARRFGPAIAATLVNCAGWPVAATPLVPVEAADAPPILVIGTVDDPATPYEWAEALRDDLATAGLLTWQGAGHTAYPKTDCVIDAVDRYLIELVMPTDGTSCPA